MKNNIILFTFILFSTLCFAQEADNKWNAGLGFNNSKLSKYSSGRVLSFNPYFSKQLSKRLDVGLSYLFSHTISIQSNRSNWFDGGYQTLSTRTQNNYEHSISFFPRYKLIYRKKFSLDLTSRLGYLKDKRTSERRDESFRMPAYILSSSANFNVFSGKLIIGLNYDLNSKLRIRISKSILSYDRALGRKKNYFYRVNGYKYFSLDFLEFKPIYLGLEYRF